MPLIENNFNTMNESECFGEKLIVAENVRMRINCEFLHSCAFHCSGCYVNRTNDYDQNQLDILYGAIEQMRNNGMTFDEIILGPTDFFAALNSDKIIAEPTFKKIFQNGDVVLTLLTTLQTNVEEIERLIGVVNENLTHPSQEIEVLIVFDLEKMMAGDITYIEGLKKRIQLLNQFNADIDYALQMNIQNVDKLQGKFTLDSITKFVRHEFNTIVEFNPSFLRTRKEHITRDVLTAWNDMLIDQLNPNNIHDITFTMANTYHAGFNELTYNFHNGYLYMCPFVYENVFDKTDHFKINRMSDLYTFDELMNYEAFAKIKQFEYAPKTTECGDCPYQMSCIAKHVLFYMETYGIKDCMIAKDVVKLLT